MKRARWEAVDRMVAGYAAWVALLVVSRSPVVPRWQLLAVAHAAIVGILLILPRRGAGWELPGESGTGRRAWVQLVRFLRYAYPLPLMLLFFEEVELTVNAVFANSPYWFEPYLYAADRAMFGALPAEALAPLGTALLDEVMHALYFSYYLILIGGLVLAYRGADYARFITTMTAAFLLSFLPYPFLAARGPWEDHELMASLPEFGGFVFQPLMELIIRYGAVSGGCFPSAHVAGAWGVVFGLWGAARRSAAAWLAALAAGMSAACVYTRYHHGVDVIAGLGCGVLGAWIGSRTASPNGRHALGRG